MSTNILHSVLGTVALSILASACFTGETDDEPVPSIETVRADSLYMKGITQKLGTQTAFKLDLTDEKQFDFVKNRMRRAGVTPKTAPEVFQRLVRSRDLAIAKKLNPFGKSSHGLAPQDAAAETPARCDGFVFPKELNPGEFTTQAKAGCINGFEYNYTDTYQYDADGNVLAYDAVENWVDGVTDLQITSVPPAGKEVWADGFIAAYTDATEEYYYYPTSMLTNHKDATQMTLTMDHPTDLNRNGEIRLCLERSTASADCDYKHDMTGAFSGDRIYDNAGVGLFPVAPAPYNNNKLYIPLKGSSTPAVANTMVIDRAKAWLTLSSPGDTTPGGGFCTKDLTGSPNLVLQAFTAVRKGLRILPFAPEFGNATWPDHCVDHRQSVDLNLEITTKDPATGAAGPTFVFSSQKNADHISIWWGCMPTGTQIEMGDGSKVSIEKLAVGQKVMAGENGKMLTVVDVVEGVERKPLVRLVDSKGHTLSVTDTHPMPTADSRILQARELMVGDKIQTADGLSTIVSMEQEDYEGPVYNLVLGTPEERAALGNTETTMFANGVLVGDAQMQSLIKLRADEAALAKRMSSLPSELRHDYELTAARKELRDAIKRQ